MNPPLRLVGTEESKPYKLTLEDAVMKEGRKVLVALAEVQISALNDYAERYLADAQQFIDTGGESPTPSYQELCKDSMGTYAMVVRLLSKELYADQKTIGSLHEKYIEATENISSSIDEAVARLEAAQ